MESIKGESLRKALIAAGNDYVDRNNWDVHIKDYLELVDSLTAEAL
jgi:hypothetical protein